MQKDGYPQTYRVYQLCYHSYPLYETIDIMLGYGLEN